MREVKLLLAPTAYTFATDTVELNFNVPKWAVGALFNLNVASMSGTAETVDLKLQHIGPHAAAAKDVLGASITQLAAAANILLTIDPRITVVANVAIAHALSSQMRALLSLGGSTDEAYNIALSVEFYS